MGEQFEYQRHPAKWKEVNEKLASVKAMAPSNVTFQICSTVNAFNIFSLAKLVYWVKQFDPKYFYVNTCFEPLCFNIQTLPRQVKDIATDRYGDIKDFQQIINFMNSEDKYSDEIAEQRRSKILQTDLYRNENFKKTYPTLNNLYKIYA